MLYLLFQHNQDFTQLNKVTSPLPPPALSVCADSAELCTEVILSRVVFGGRLIPLMLCSAPYFQSNRCVFIACLPYEKTYGDMNLAFRGLAFVRLFSKILFSLTAGFFFSPNIPQEATLYTVFISTCHKNDFINWWFFKSSFKTFMSRQSEGNEVHSYIVHHVNTDIILMSIWKQEPAAVYSLAVSECNIFHLKAPLNISNSYVIAWEAVVRYNVLINVFRGSGFQCLYSARQTVCRLWLYIYHTNMSVVSNLSPHYSGKTFLLSNLDMETHYFFPVKKYHIFSHCVFGTQEDHNES